MNPDTQIQSRLNVHSSDFVAALLSHPHIGAILRKGADPQTLRRLDKLENAA